MPGSVAFYTTGDTRPVFPGRVDDNLYHQGVDASYSNLYELFAFDHARRVYAADTVHAAWECIRTHEAGSIARLFFIGHGDAGFYAFHVAPDSSGRNEVVVENAEVETLWGNPLMRGLHEGFVNEIVRVADRHHGIDVRFYSCFTARGNLLGQVSDALWRASIPHRVSGTRRFWHLTGVTTASGRSGVHYRASGPLEVVMGGH